MKYLFIMLWLWSSTILANTKNPTTSKIKAVTVFADGAQITRYAKISVPQGTTEFSIPKLSSYIKENSIQIAGLNGASILSIKYAINHISKFDRTETVLHFQDELQRLNDNIRLEQDKMEGYSQEIKIIEDNRKLGNNTYVVSLDKLKQFAAYYRQRITELHTLTYKSLKKNNTYAKQIKDIKKQLQELHVDDKIQTGEIKIKLSSNLNTNLNLIIKYNVSNAGWFPVYDLKAKHINQPLQLHYKAHIYQTTGVSWDNVNLKLCTNDPTTNNIKPKMDTKFLNFISNYSNYTPKSVTKKYEYQFNPFIKTISGIVTDKSGTPLPGVNIVEKGTANGTTTDFDGIYNLKIDSGKELVFSYLGFNTESIAIHSSVINIALKEDLAQLDEVIVVGYAGKHKSRVKNSVSSVKHKSLKTLLQGKVSGIKVRGSSSLNSNSNPLYIIDGVMSTNSIYNTIDPKTITDIEVLKDATTAGIYGSKAANGVVLVTTTKAQHTAYGDSIKKGISNTSFSIQKLATITSDGNITVINIDNFEIPATYSYFAAPVINENVFLTAKIGNWQQLNLLPGEANIYFEDSYSGTTPINPYATTDSLTISLGVDPNVIINRKPTNNFKKTNFIGNNKIIDKGYDIIVKNNKPSPINIVIVDRIPISQNKDIKVDNINFGTSNYDTKRGILTWKAKIESGNTEKYHFLYSVKYPKHRKISI